MKNYFVGLAFIIILPAIGMAQDTLTKREIHKQQRSFLLNNRPWSIEVPIWIPGYAGSFAYGDVNVEGEDGADPENPIEPPGGVIGDILSRLFTTNWYLKFFYLTKISYENKNFLVQLDGITGAAGNSVKFNYNNKEIVQLTFTTLNTRLLGGYRAINVPGRNGKFRYELYPYIGFRFFFQKIHSDLNDIVNSLDIKPVWVDPVFGIQNQFTWKRWFIVLQGDFGGYLTNNKQSAQLAAFVYFRTGRFTSFKFGWNHLYIHRTGTYLREDYTIKANFSGPSVGITFHF